MRDQSRLDIHIQQGATWRLHLTWSIDGVPCNLTGWTARMQIRSGYCAPTALVSLTNGAGITLGGADGTIALEISATQTAGLPRGRLVYDLELVTGTEVTRLIHGMAIVSPEVTR